jgi:hypothetical protein
MNKEIFKSDRHFTVFDFLISHGQLLLRSSKDDSNIKNIDIIFFGIKYIQLFTSLIGISIRIVDKNQSPTNYNSVNTFLNSDENYLFEIETNSEKYFVGASFVKIFENELEFNQSSLGLNQTKGREKQIAGSR